MAYGPLRVFIAMTLVASPVLAGDRYKVDVALPGETLSLSELPSDTYAGNRGHYFTIVASVSNLTSVKRTFMVDDDCTFASWKLTGKPLDLMVESCRKNVFEEISLGAGEAYTSTIKAWLPENYPGSEIKFSVGFVEIVDHKNAAGPYWSGVNTVFIRK